MRPDIVNRIVFVLACAGGAIALIIGMFHLFEASIPCGDVAAGAVSGCDQVAKSPWAKVAGLPTAFIGAALYVLVAVLAMVRESKGVSSTARLGGAVWALLGAGTVASIFLLVHASLEVQAVCVWCWASGVIMLLAFVAQTAGQISRRESRATRLPMAAMGVFAVLSMGGAGAWGYIAAKESATVGMQVLDVKPSEDVQLVRPDSPSIGPEDAPIVIVAFSDMHCPSCGRNHMYVKQQMEGRLKGKIRLVFRHFPLLGTHPNSGTAAIFAEYAKSKDKFWEFADAMMQNQDLSSPEDMTALLAAIGLDSGEAMALLTSEELRQPFAESVHRDRLDGYKLEVSVTPTWYVRYPDGSILSSTGDGIETLLSDREIQRRSGPAR